MPRRRVIDFLPEMYRGFLPEFFDSPLAEERHATCDTCAMCPPPEPELPPESYYSPSVKCCTFYPTLPNYAVGGLLADASDAGAEGRRRIERKIVARVGVTPFGVVTPAKYLHLHRHSAAAFGRAESLACPYLDRDRGLCTVWASREAECATWFCKHNQGLDGRDFWKQLRDYLVGVERMLIAWVLRELGFEAEQIVAGSGIPTELDARDLDDRPPSDHAYARLWGEWLGRERDLYATAHRMVASLDRSGFAGLAGLQGELDLARVTRRHQAIAAPTLPDPLRRNPTMRVERAPDGSYVLSTYPNGELTRLRKPVYDLLAFFDGRTPTAGVRDAIHSATGFTVSGSFLTTLYHHRIVVDPATIDP